MSLAIPPSQPRTCKEWRQRQRRRRMEASANASTLPAFRDGSCRTLLPPADAAATADDAPEPRDLEGQKRPYRTKGKPRRLRGI